MNSDIEHALGHFYIFALKHVNIYVFNFLVSEFMELVSFLMPRNGKTFGALKYIKSYRNTVACERLVAGERVASIARERPDGPHGHRRVAFGYLLASHFPNQTDALPPRGEGRVGSNLRTKTPAREVEGAAGWT